MFAYNTLRDVFAPTGLNAMKNEFGFFVREPWLDKLNIQVGGVNKDNFKRTKLYKFLYANAFKYNSMFEMEAYKDGYSNDVNSPYSYEFNLLAKKHEFIATGKFLDDPSSMVQFMERKRRLNPLDFADILDINITPGENLGAVPGAAGGKTSEGVWEALFSNGYINNYGLFNKKMGEKLFSSGRTIDNLFGTDDKQININGALPDNDEIKKKIALRIYDIFSVDDYQYSAVEYNYQSRPRLFVRAHPNLTSNGYVDILANKELEQSRPDNWDSLSSEDQTNWMYQFLKDEFANGESKASRDANEAAKSYIDSSANSATQPAPTFSDVYLTNWGSYSGSNVTLDGHTYSVNDVRNHLYNNLSAGTERDFFSNVILTGSQQKEFYDQFLAAKEGQVPDGYSKSAGTKIGSWVLPNFVENSPGAGGSSSYSLSVSLSAGG